MESKSDNPNSSANKAELFQLPGQANLEQAPIQPESEPSQSTEQPTSSNSGAQAEKYLSNPEQPKQSVASTPSLPAPQQGSQSDSAPPAQPAASPVAVTDDDSPQIADDVDVIEKEWVDKARQIIEDTKDHPYRQEKEVERLQQSYLKKRYGKDVSSASKI